MRRIIPFLLLLCVASLAHSQSPLSSADSAVLRQILTANKAYRTLQCNIRHDLIKSGKSQRRYGTLYTERVKNAKSGDVSAQIAMHYTMPQGESYIITSTHLYNAIDGHDIKFNYKIVPLMKQLGGTVSWGFVGDVFSILRYMKLDIAITSDAKNHIITLTSGKRNKGISRMLLKYNRTNGLINYMEIDEALGVTHRFSMGQDAAGKTAQPIINHPIDSKVFDIK